MFNCRRGDEIARPAARGPPNQQIWEEYDPTSLDALNWNASGENKRQAISWNIESCYGTTSRRNGYGDNRGSFWGDAQGRTVNNFTVKSEHKKYGSLLYINAYDEPELHDLRRCVLSFLKHICPGKRMFADVWWGSLNAFHEAKVGEWISCPENRNRFACELDLTGLNTLNESWFDSRCTCLYVCDTDVSIQDFISFGWNLPEYNLRKRSILAYICSDEQGGFCIGTSTELRSAMIELYCLVGNV